MRTKKRVIETIAFWFLLITLVLSVVYAVTQLVGAPMNTAGGEIESGKSDYVLMLIQCILGIVVMFLPSILERKFKIVIPSFMYILFFLFLYGAIYLGEIKSFYYKVPHWDVYLHSLSAMMLGTLGFSVVSLLNNTKRVKLQLSPLFVSIFAFCFALSIGALWEIYEFTFDSLLGLNMQKFILGDGTVLVGQEALMDTMKDLIVDACGALLVSLIGFFSMKGQQKWIQRVEMKRLSDLTSEQGENSPQKI